MKEIKILHLFPRLLSLYGEYGNAAILEKTLRDQGCDVTVTRWESGELDLSGYDFIYVGSGTEDNLLEAVKRLAPHADAIAASIEAGQLWLATGNAMTLFGTEIEYNGNEYRGLGALPYATEIAQTRYLGDVLTADAFGAPMIGFVNTSCEYQSIQDTMLEFHLGERLGNVKGTKYDGIRHANFYGTQLIGPVMVKNPHFLSYMVQQITGQAPEIPDDSNIRKAYAVSVGELKKRLQ